MPVFFGKVNKKKELDRLNKPLLSENSRTAEITSVGIAEGLGVVYEVFEKKGILKALKTTSFYHCNDDGDANGKC